MIPNRHAMVGGLDDATFVGWRTVGAGATSIAPPVGTQLRDFIVINYFNAITLSGGPGVSLQHKAGFGYSKVSCGVIESGDPASAFTFSTAGPAIMGVWRGPTSMSDAISSLTSSGALDYNSGTGFARSGAAVAIVAAGCVGGSGPTELYFRRKADGVDPGPFDQSATQLTTGVSYAMAGITQIAGYVDNTPFRTNTEDVANTVYARFYELRN